MPPAVEVQILNHWTTREVPQTTVKEQELGAVETKDWSPGGRGPEPRGAGRPEKLEKERG